MAGLSTNARDDSFRGTAAGTGGPMPRKLDVGCSFRKPEGYWGTDAYGFAGVDQVFDHNEYPWPLPDNYFDEARLWHILQYLTDTERALKEIWRVSRNGARVEIGVPYFMSTLGFGDRNRSFFTEHTLKVFTDQSWYAEHVGTFGGGAKFCLVRQGLRTTGRFRILIPFKRLLKPFLWNMYDELEAELEVIKG